MENERKLCWKLFENGGEKPQNSNSWTLFAINKYVHQILADD